MKIKTYKLSEISRISAGGDRPRNFCKNKTETLNIPVYSNGKEKNDLIGFTDYAKITTPSITISARGTVGYVSLRLEPYVPIIRLISVEPDINKVDLLYLYYLLNNKKVTGEGSIQKQLTVPMISNLEITIHDLSMQKHISKILYDLDSKIVLNNKINLELEDLTNTIYNYWFVQFDFPDENGKPYKSSGGQMVWNEELKKEIPKDWEVCDLENLLSLNSRGISPKYSTSGTAVLNQKCIRNGTIVEEGIQFHNDEKIAPEWAYLKPYDILINSMGVGTLGRISQTFLKRDTKYLIHSCITLLRTNNKIHPILLGFIIKNLQTKIENMGTGSTGQTSLSNKNLGKIKVVLPITIIQNKFIDITKPILEKVDMNYIQNEELAKLRDFLLPLLMNGQIKIND